jgi:serine/threonine protein kinase
MNATGRDYPGAAFDETVAQAPPSAAGPVEASPARPAQYRYIFSSGSRPLEGYTIKRAIGRGGFGEVYYATSDAGKEVALKLIVRNLDVERRGVQQCMNLKSHHLITVFDLKENDAGDSFVVMEYITGPSLAQILSQHPNGLPLSDVKFWLKGLVEGVAYLHDHGIVHRDLKPANLFLEEGVVKIGDYGLSKSITSSNEPGHSESVGTCHYMAPEIASGKYHKPIDVYAIGVILYEIITGRVPFDGETVGEVLMKHLTSQPDLSPLPSPYREIVRSALAKEPERRPARVLDLLPPGEIPPEPSVRFLGDKDSPPRPPSATFQAGNDPEPEEVLHITAEEPVFYIGENTMPLPRKRTYRETVRRLTTPRPVRSGQGRVIPAVSPARAAPVPPPEPPLPAGRVRLAELLTSMVLATPVAALAAGLCVPLFRAFSIHAPQNPQQLAYLFAVTLAGTWIVLATTKAWEVHPETALARRGAFLGMGSLLGLGAVALAQWVLLSLPPTVAQTGFPGFSEILYGRVSEHWQATFMLAPYFALAMAVNPWWKLTARGRSRRFRLWSTIKVAVLAGLIGLVWPSPQPWATLVIVLIAIVSQVVSPWSREAADYAWATRFDRKRRAA